MSHLYLIFWNIPKNSNVHFPIVSTCQISSHIFFHCHRNFVNPWHYSINEKMLSFQVICETFFDARRRQIFSQFGGNITPEKNLVTLRLRKILNLETFSLCILVLKCENGKDNFYLKHFYLDFYLSLGTFSGSVLISLKALILSLSELFNFNQNLCKRYGSLRFDFL